MQHRFAPFPITTPESDLIVWSHLRWDFVFQRPQHLLSRFAKTRRVFFFEEPLFGTNPLPKLNFAIRENGLIVVTPELQHGLTETEGLAQLKHLVDELIEREEIESFTSWYYTPMFLPFTSHLNPEVTIFDVMDELSAFKGAPPRLLQLEEDLMKRADLVFTGGQSLYEAKKHRHHHVHCFPSSIDAAHFSTARTNLTTPSDQATIAHPRIGFFGVLDERFDIELLRDLSALRPDWHFVMIGPVVKINPSDLPTASNIHYLGMKSYAELPNYLSGWDLAILPFARNESTRFISPTKTPEYLAAGCPVVSTSIKDVVRPYGDLGLVGIADDAAEFVKAAEFAMDQRKNDPTWLLKVDAFLADKSWDETSKNMMALEKKVHAKKHEVVRNFTQPTHKNSAVYATELKS